MRRMVTRCCKKRRSLRGEEEEDAQEEEGKKNEEQEEGEENVKRTTVERMKTRRLWIRMSHGKKRRRVHRMERRKRLKKAKRFQRRKRIRRKGAMSRTGLYVMADNYCFPAFGSTLKIDESLNSINVQLSHQLITYTDQFLLFLPYPYTCPYSYPLGAAAIHRKVYKYI